MEGKNTGLLDYDVSIRFSCDINQEIQTTAAFDIEKRVFNINVETKYACKKDLSQAAIVFHQYRFFIMGICVVLGIYTNYFGLRKVKRTLKILGFFFTFFFSFFLFTAMFYSSILKSLS